MAKIKHRRKGYRYLKGWGLEIGALNLPASVPRRCKVEYCDVQSKEGAISLFPELPKDGFVDVDHVCDLDTEGLSIFADNVFDFVILNHVIEHIANPIRIIEELFRITKEGGTIVLSAPDRNYTFDKNRSLTSFDHLLGEYHGNVTEVADEHYLDFLRAVHPEVLGAGPGDLKKRLDRVRERREHAHVWDSTTFKEFLVACLDMLGLNATCLYESSGEDNHSECFSAWRKTMAKCESKTPKKSSAAGRLRSFLIRHLRQW